MRFPRTLPSQIIAPVLITLSANLVTVAVVNLVEPARSSGPTGSVINRASSVAAGLDRGLAEASISRAVRGGPGSLLQAPAGLQVSRIVLAPNDFARASAPRTKGVRPLAVIPSTTSAGFTRRSSKA